MAGKLSNENLKMVASVHTFYQQAEKELNDIREILDNLNFLLFVGNESDIPQSGSVPDDGNDVQGVDKP